jgi:hypothetical protein
MQIAQKMLWTTSIVVTALVGVIFRLSLLQLRVMRGAHVMRIGGAASIHQNVPKIR